MNIYRLLLSFVLLFLNCYIVNSQVILQGVVQNQKKEPLPYSNILIKKNNSNKILVYTVANEEGEYVVSLPEEDELKLEVTALGYKEQLIVLVKDELSSSNKIIKNFVLQEELVALKEVIVQAEKSIIVKKDTIRFKAKSFSQGNEQNVEDLLSKIPGLEINSEGRIKVGKHEIEKLMIDGDDFFGKGYKVLSKNMPAHPIEEIEILKNYSNNRLLKGVENNNNKVALNLKIKDKAKRIWFGSGTLGYGLATENRYEIKGSLMNFGKKSKYFFLTNLNNLGFDVTGNIKYLIKSSIGNESVSIGDNQNAYDLLRTSTPSLNFKKERYNFNNSELLSLNTILNPTKKIKIKALGFFNWDEVGFYKRMIESVVIDKGDFVNTENFNLRSDQNTAFGRLDFIYSISKNKMLEAVTKVNSIDFYNVSNITFNTIPSKDLLQSKNKLFDQKINYTNKLNDKKVLMLTGRFISEKTPQEYTYNKFLFQNLFLNNKAITNLKQTAQNSMYYLGVNAHLLKRYENENILSLQIGNELRKDELQTRFSLLTYKNTVLMPKKYQNNTVYKVNDLYLKGKYLLKLDDILITSKLYFHQYLNSLNNFEVIKKENPFYINSSINFSWEINTENKITAFYSYNTTISKVTDVYSNYYLTGFRSFTKGTNNFNSLNKYTINLDYELGNFGDRFFAYVLAYYIKNNDFFSTNSIIDKNYTKLNKIVVKDKISLGIQTKIDYYFRQIHSNFRLKFNYTNNNYKNQVNYSKLRKVSFNNSKYAVELRSAFSGFFNYHIGTDWMINSIKTPIKKTYTNTSSFLDLSFNFSDKISMDLDSEYYNFEGDFNNDYYFTDLKINYILKKDKVKLSITGKNLFNTKTFQNISLNDIQTSLVEYRLLPRFVLFSMEYRF